MVLLVGFVLLIGIIYIFFIGRPMSVYYNEDEIDKIEIMSGNTGEVVEIKDMNGIKQMLDQISNTRVRKKVFQEASDGWAYSLTFYSENKVITNIRGITSIKCSINQSRYTMSRSVGINLIDIIDAHFKSPVE